MEQAKVEDVPAYCSSSDESKDSPKELPSAKKKRTCGKEYVFVKKFADAKEAESFVQSENTWSFRVLHDTDIGKKKFYRCKQVKARGPQCPASLYLLFEADSNNVLLYRTTSGHDHQSVGLTINRGICKKTKKEINKLFALHLKPKAILNSLSKIEGIRMPTKKQLENYLSERRRAVYGSPTISLGELQAWLIEHSEEPDDEHEPYVISYYVYEGETPTFRFAISTKTLLKLTTVATNIHADATYKIVWQGFPLLIMGTTDKTKKFHPICLAISTSEKKQDFKMLFEAVRNCASSLYAHTFEPKALICDAAKSIQNAFKEVYGPESTVKMCWAHAKKNMQCNVERLVTKKKQKSLLRDIDALHSASSPDIFKKALAAFLRKYSKEKAFITYFRKEWVRRNPNWYLGSAKGSPVTNNALESFNRTIKDCHTYRDRYPLSRFLLVIKDMVKQWSETHQPETFSNTPFLQLKNWTTGYQWAKSDKKVVVLRADTEKKTYLITSSKAANVQFGQNWRSFKEYKQVAFAYWTVVLPKNKEEWKKNKL